MTDERMCQDCGHVRNDHVAVCVECERFDQDPRYHDFEAAPSTDEGEARMPVRRCAVCEGEITASSGEWWIPEQILHVEGGEPHRAVYVRDWQAAAIRTPLEERIRELEADVQNAIYAEMEVLRRAGAEVKRLREALRPLVKAYDETEIRADHEDSCPAHPDRIPGKRSACLCGIAEIEEAFEHARALATPPSSTEGTDDEPTFDRLSMHRSEDWGTKEVEG